MTVEYVWLSIFAIIIGMVIIDPNVGTFIVILSKTARVNVERMFWMIRFHPVIFSSPIGRWWMMRKYMRTAKKLAQELSKKDSDAV